MSRIVGIDLGTTKSVVGYWSDQGPQIVSAGSGERSIPSLVLVTPDEQIYAGLRAAKHPQRYESKNITISSVKRLMGSRGETGWGWWKTYPQEVSAFVLSELRLHAENLLEEEVARAVVAIPSHFDESQRRATKEAATIAGLEVPRLLNEATAAILAYSYSRKTDEKVAVFDLGGGTLDVSVAHCGDGVIEVLTIEGESKLGGDDFTQALVDHVKEQMGKEFGAEVEADPVRGLVLREAAEQAKIQLSTSHQATIYIPGFISTGGGPQPLKLDVHRDTFEALTKPLVDKAVETLRRALQRAGVTKPDALLLLGGGCRTPVLRHRIKHELGLDPFTGVDPETCVAEGSVVLAAILAGELDDVLTLDVTPSSYGVGMADGEYKPIIEKDTTVPTSHRETFTTTEEHQGSLSIHLYQGESAKAAENTQVGVLTLAGIPLAPAGVPQIEVTLDVGVDLIVRARATDMGSGKEREIEVQSPYGLNRAQLKLMSQRLSRWRADRKTAELMSARELREQVEETLHQSRRVLEPAEITMLEDCLGALEAIEAPEADPDSLSGSISSARQALEMAQGEVRRHREMLRAAAELSEKIAGLGTMPSPSRSPELAVLHQGAALIEDFIARGVPRAEIEKLLGSVRWSYWEFLAKEIVVLLTNLRESEDFRDWQRSIGACDLANREALSAFMSYFLTIEPVRLITDRLSREQDHVDRILARFSSITGDDPALLGTCFVVAGASSGLRHAPELAELPTDTGIARCCAAVLLHALRLEAGSIRRSALAGEVVRLLPPREYLSEVASLLPGEREERVLNALLGYVDQHGPGTLSHAFSGLPDEARETARSNRALLIRLSEEPAADTWRWAITHLAGDSGEEVLPVFKSFLEHEVAALRHHAFAAFASVHGRAGSMRAIVALALADEDAGNRREALRWASSAPPGVAIVDISDLVSLARADECDEIRRASASLLLERHGREGAIASLKLALEAGRNAGSPALDLLESTSKELDPDLRKLVSLTTKVLRRHQRLGMLDRLAVSRIAKKSPDTARVVSAMKSAARSEEHPDRGAR